MTNWEGGRKPKYGPKGVWRTPEYHSWSAMRRRCLSPNSPAYKDYGGRGITVCEEWRNSFLAFLRDMGQRPEGFTLERIDNDGSYCKSNCRWATPQEQRHNQRPKTIRNQQVHRIGTSGFIGVYHASKNSWAATFRKRKIGNFGTPEDAATAYNFAAEAHYGKGVVAYNLPQEITHG